MTTKSSYPPPSFLTVVVVVLLLDLLVVVVFLEQHEVEFDMCILVLFILLGDGTKPLVN